MFYSALDHDGTWISPIGGPIGKRALASILQDGSSPGVDADFMGDAFVADILSGQ